MKGNRPRPIHFFPALPVLLIILGVAVYSGAWPAPLSVAPLSSGWISVGGLSAGIVSIGFAATGIISIGVFSSGVIGIGVFSTGTVALGIWAAGRYATIPILTWIWEWKFANRAYRAEEAFIALDILRPALSGKPDALFLDLACGTGRLSRLLVSTDWFQGRIRGIDASTAMLAGFRDALAALPDDARSRVVIEQGDLASWSPDTGGLADAVALLEVSEMLPFLPDLLPKIAAASPPGGALIMTRTPAPVSWLFPGSGQSRAAIQELLEANGFTDIRFIPWTWRYEFVTARRLP